MNCLKINPIGYQIDEIIYSSLKIAVYRGQRESDGQSVAVKVMQTEYPSFSELAQFRNQYAIAKNLDLPGVIKAYSLEKYRNGYALVMEDMGGISLKQYIKDRPLSLAEFFPIAIALASTLEGLYRQRVIHKDIKPANILIHPTTKQVKLIDFSIASLLPRETQTLCNPNVLEGTLAYISPEQTGRMNRGVDYRSDFYSLGVTFFELLTGKLPFTAIDPMELVHCHIAKQPDEIKSEEIPEMISEIVMKLMAKNAEDRYQSALGLKHDLEICYQQWREKGKIDSFDLSQRDICDRFLIPEKLYGRQREVNTLLQVFDRVASPKENYTAKGNSQLMLVTGFSGIGKTAVVNEVHKPIVRQRGYFIKGKFDQFCRNIPFSAFVQAFRELMQQLLSESETELKHWQSKIISALGTNGQVIIEVIPELEFLIGNQPSVPELSGIAAQNRFNLLFQKFIKVFATEQHPLTIFLDDLQWIDSASLNLIKLLICDQKIGYLLLIGAYRNNEVLPTHPLMLALEEIERSQVSINTIELTSLDKSDINYLIADTLKCTNKLAQPLAELAYQKTKGNPFFTSQFLKALHHDNLINFNRESGYWQCDLARIRALALTDDVVEFMAVQLQKLPIETQEVLKLAACIGNQFDLTTLAIVREQSPAETAADLWKALQEGLIIPTTEIYKFFQSYINNDNHEFTDVSEHVTVSYKFLHDRIQQAAYVLIPDRDRKATHLKIGQLLLEKTVAAEREAKIFDLVNQLNIGSDLITETEKQIELANLNLIAGKTAKVSTAYAAAFGYFQSGIKLLPKNAWSAHYNLTLSLYESATESAYLTSNFGEMEELAAVVLLQAENILDRIKVYEVQIQFKASQNKQLEALQLALSVLEKLGVNFPENPAFPEIQQGFETTSANLEGKSSESLMNLPEMTDLNKRSAIRILANLIGIVYQAAPEFFPLIAFEMVNLSVRYGTTPESIYGYAVYGVVLCAIFEDIESGYRYGKLASDWLYFWNLPQIKARAYLVINANIRHWKESAKATLQPLLEAYHISLEIGDLEYSATNAYVYNMVKYLIHPDLAEIEQEMLMYENELRRLKQAALLYYHQISLQAVLNLRQQSNCPWELTGNIYNERESLPIHEAAKDGGALSRLYINKLMLGYLFNQLEIAEDCATKAEQHLYGVGGTILVPTFYFYDSLVRLALCRERNAEEREILLKKVADNQQKLENSSNHAPMNYLHKYLLVEAERNRVAGNKAAAIELYDRAISLAKENEYLSEEAIAHELAGKFYLEWGKDKVAQSYIVDAYYAYSRWGALAKVKLLEQNYDKLLSFILLKNPQKFNYSGSGSFSDTLPLSIYTLSQSSVCSSTSLSEVLDISSVIKASQTLSSEIEFDKLIGKLMKFLMENVGACKSVLMLVEGEELVLSAIAKLGEAGTYDVDRAVSVDANREIPFSLVNYVSRTKQTLVLDDVEFETKFPSNHYLIHHQPKSLLCTALLDRGKFIGIVYLENHRSRGAFTHDRLEIINLLCSQAAICVENAQLYRNLQQSEAREREKAFQLEQSLQQLQQTQLQLIQNEKMATLGNLVAGVAHEINNPTNFIEGNIIHAQDYFEDLLHHLQLYQQEFPNPSQKIKQDAAVIELDFIIKDVPNLLDSMKLGVERIRHISSSLRSFSRTDTSQQLAFNIHEGIDSTLLILKYRLQSNEKRSAIKVVKDYGNLPLVKCFPGQLNQVFMNILANAIDAFDEMSQDSCDIDRKARPSQIAIRTEVNSDRKSAIVHIQDNGPGMTEDVKKRVFDHLFTTKAIGKGTGLGLSISRQIVEEKHRGQLSCLSTLGKGTEFIIEIPIL
ncbi:MAG TPA: AAA family ATPase [Leptolyngbyaceae cyanobacterium]